MPGSDEITVAVSVSSFCSVTDEPRLILERAGARIIDNPYGRKLTADEVSDLLRDVDGLIAGTEPLTAAVLESADRLKVISRVGIGLDNVDLEAAERLGIAVRNTPTAITDAVAELVLTGMLNVVRRVHEMDAELRAGRWTRRMGGLLRERTIGLYGFGRVGQALARLLQPFHPTLLAYDVAPDISTAAELDVALVDVDDLLARSDIVSLHVSGAAPKPLLGPRELAEMKRGAIVVNTARGGLVDESALLEGLRHERLGGAYLDVFVDEPYSGPLRELPNVVLTPHAGSYAREARSQMEIEAATNLVEVLRANGR